MKIRAFVCGVYTLLCALLQWANNSGIAQPFVILFCDVSVALWKFGGGLCEFGGGLCNSSIGIWIWGSVIWLLRLVTDTFMKGFNFVKCMGSLFLVIAAPNMCFVVALLVFILDMYIYSSATLAVYNMPRARIWMQGIDKLAGANCQCLKLVRSMDIVALPKCTATNEEEGLKGLLSQQVCEMLNYCVTSSMVCKDKDVLVANTFLRGYSILNGQTTTLSTSETTTLWLFYNIGCLYGFFNNYRDFWTYYHGVLFCISVFNLWCFYMRLLEFDWQKALFEYCTMGAWLQTFLFFMGQYIIKSIFPQWSGAQDNTTDNENPSTPQGTHVTWGATSTSHPAQTPSQHQTPSIWPLQNIQSRMPATQYGARQVSPRATQTWEFADTQFRGAPPPYQAPVYNQVPLYPSVPVFHPADTRRSTSATALGTRAKSPATRRQTTSRQTTSRRTPTTPRGFY